MFLPLTFFLIFCAAAATMVAKLFPVLTRYAVRRGWVDHPDQSGGRKDHGRPVPPIGGLVIVPIFLILLPSLGFLPQDHWPLYLGLAVVVVMGWYDDRYNLRPELKLAGQVAVALLLAITGEATLTHLGDLFGTGQTLYLSWVAIPFTAACFIFFMNAMNMMDGLDGLAGGQSFVMLLCLAVAAMMGGDPQLSAVALLMMALLFGFLVHNMRYPGHKRATIFLGDSGSLALGAIIAWLGVQITMDSTPGVPPIAIAFIIMVPIMDTFALFIARVINGRGALTPGRDHLHHRLLSRGWGVERVVVVILVCSLLISVTAMLISQIPQYSVFLGFIWLIFLATYTFFKVLRSHVPQ
jgi:UDP-GlcNAc:undecaprenyl-phosphate GlcNAc-1-phosphate transferase